MIVCSRVRGIPEPSLLHLQKDLNQRSCSTPNQRKGRLPNQTNKQTKQTVHSFQFLPLIIALSWSRRRNENRSGRRTWPVRGSCQMFQPPLGASPSSSCHTVHLEARRGGAARRALAPSPVVRPALENERTCRCAAHVHATANGRAMTRTTVNKTSSNYRL